jgi:hypothetical protein
MKYLFLLILIFSSSITFAQKKPLLSTKEEISAATSKELNESFETGKLKKVVDKYGITGLFEYDITVGDQKELQTIFTIRRDDLNQEFNKKLLVALKDFKYQNFKIPKYKSQKFRYTINIE